MENCAIIVFWVFAVVCSLFYGFKAPAIFSVPSSDWTWPQKVHQFWFNFIGAMVGWTATYFLLFERLQVFGGQVVTEPRTLIAMDCVIGLVAIVGITGHLPMTLAGVVQGFSALGLEALKKLKSLI